MSAVPVSSSTPWQSSATARSAASAAVSRALGLRPAEAGAPAGAAVSAGCGAGTVWNGWSAAMSRPRRGCGAELLDEVAEGPRLPLLVDRGGGGAERRLVHL